MSTHQWSNLVEAVVCATPILGTLIVCLIKDRQLVNQLKKRNYQS